jgi:hypothetical protein
MSGSPAGRARRAASGRSSWHSSAVRAPVFAPSFRVAVHRRGRECESMTPWTRWPPPVTSSPALPGRHLGDAHRQRPRPTPHRWLGPRQRRPFYPRSGRASSTFGIKHSLSFPPFSCRLFGLKSARCSGTRLADCPSERMWVERTGWVCLHWRALWCWSVVVRPVAIGPQRRNRQVPLVGCR